MAFEKLRAIVIAAIPHYYLEGKIAVPFQARCVTTKAVSPLRIGWDRHGERSKKRQAAETPAK